MSKLSQKAAVFAAVTNVTGFKGEGKCEPTKDQRAMINTILIESFNKGEISLERTDYTEAEMKAYVSGLVSNWLRKDDRLNGGGKYVPKNPGSRAGSTDPELKAMRGLLATMGSEYTDEDRAEVQALIDEKVKAIAATKQAKAVNFDALPASLKAKFGK